MACEAGGGELLTQSVLVGRYGEVLQVLKDILESGEEAQGRAAIACRPAEHPQEVWVSCPGLYDRMKQMQNVKISLADVRAFCQSHAHTSYAEPKQRRLDGVNNVMVRILDAKSLKESFDALD
jgi:hypothetical protein